MDERLKLTEEQQVLIESLCSTLRELDESGVKVIFDGDFSYHFLNGENVKHLLFPEDRCDGAVQVELSDIPGFEFDCMNLCGDGHFVNVTFREE